MDWLEELAADQDLNQLARLLNTPHRKNKKFLEDGRDDLDGDEDDAPDFDDDGYGYCTVSPPNTTAHRSSTTTGMSIQDADPATPKSSNRRNAKVVLTKLDSCRWCSSRNEPLGKHVLFKISIPPFLPWTSFRRNIFGATLP